MGVAVYKGIPVKHPASPGHRIIGLFVVLLLVLLAAPAVSASAGNTVTPGNPAGPSLLTMESVGIIAVPLAAVTVQPTPEPVRENRTSLIQIAKKAAERPKVSVPSGIFLLIVAIAIIGLLVILYSLIRRTAGSIRGKKKPEKPDRAGNPTVTEGIPAPAEKTTSGYPGPAVAFPPSLEKRFAHPEFIGEGGLARVFRAQNIRTGTTVAVKVPVRFDEVTGTHFTRDIVFWQGLEHENIIRILSSNILPVPYIEMEYAPKSLAAIPLPVPEEEAVRILQGIARGLAYAHEKGIVHRDIKPENILLTAEGVPKITDWGLGKAVGDTRQSSVIGFSPAYAAPEQIAPHRYGRPGLATDIYQLGMLLAELLTGAPVFRRAGLHDLNTAILEDMPVIPPWNGCHVNELKQIILRCLAKKPEDRYASVVELIRDLETVIAFPD
jgi:eukaryotic-like serine/threonine-protein kinase